MDYCTIEVLVKNEPGVLSRVSGLFARRGFNIHSLAVGETHNPNISQMTVVVMGDESVRYQMMKQLERLVDVVAVRDLTDQPRVERGMVLIKLAAPAQGQQAVIQIIKDHQAGLMHRGEKEIVAVMEGDRQDLNELIEALKPFGILELARTGQIALGITDQLLAKPDESNDPGHTPASAKKPGKSKTWIPGFLRGKK